MFKGLAPIGIAGVAAVLVMGYIIGRIRKKKEG